MIRSRRPLAAGRWQRSFRSRLRRSWTLRPIVLSRPIAAWSCPTRLLFGRLVRRLWRRWTRFIRPRRPLVASRWQRPFRSRLRPIRPIILSRSIPPRLLGLVRRLRFRRTLWPLFWLSGRRQHAGSCRRPFAPYLVNGPRCKSPSRRSFNRIYTRPFVGENRSLAAVNVHSLPLEISNRPRLIDDDRIVYNQIPRTESGLKAVHANEHKE